MQYNAVHGQIGTELYNLRELNAEVPTTARMLRPMRLQCKRSSARLPDKVSQRDDIVIRLFGEKLMS